MEDFARPVPELRRLTVNLDSDDVSLFEGLWPVPGGVALHAWLVQGDRALVVDPWDAGGYGPEEVEADLETLGLKWTNVAAVAFTKAPEPGLIARLKAFHPGLEDWGIPTPGARHDLGRGVVVEAQDGFWFVTPSGALLTGDAFAGLGWVEDEVWADDLAEDEARYFDDEALRWFGGRPLVPTLPPGTNRVLPGHGLGWKTPQVALDRARRFEAWGRGDALDEVTVIWPADAEEGVDALVGGVLDIGAGLNLYRVPGDDPTALAAGARRASLVVLAQGLDDGFLVGMTKDLWRPAPSSAPADLRKGLVDRWDGL